MEKKCNDDFNGIAIDNKCVNYNKERSNSESNVIMPTPFKKNIEKYILKKKIGSGSFSTVYYALDSFKNEYAVKRISLSGQTDEMLDRFLLELKISYKLNHKNIVKCYDIFRTQNSWYIVSEYCNYGTFYDLISSLKTTDYEKKEKMGHYYLCQLKDAIEYLHESNIIHRDLKPMNILISHKSNEITVKLADFGFSRYFENNNINKTTGYDDMISTICGSPIYMAPELLINLKYNTKADIWSFGVIMYELLYGTNPYYYPKNIPDLIELIKKENITYGLFSDNCVNLLKNILIIDPVDRISWKDFFKHSWFDKYQTNALCEDDSQIFEFDEEFEKNTLEHEQHQQLFKHENYDELHENLQNNDDFIVVDSHELVSKQENNTSVKTYKETYMGSIIKIVTSSIVYILGGDNNQAHSI